MRRTKKRNERYRYDGPLTRIFGGPTARILDQADIVGNMEQTVPMLSESTGLTHKTVQKTLNQLMKHKLVRKGRKVNGDQSYRFNVETTLRDLVNWSIKLAFTPQTKPKRTLVKTVINEMTRERTTEPPQKP
jgi:hypothetical protein